MTIFKKLGKTFVVALTGAVLLMSVQAPVMAGMVSNDQIAAESKTEVKRDEVASFLAREDVKEALLEQGVTKEQVEKRLGNLTDSEITQIHEQVADMPAGGDFLGAVLALIVIFMLLDMAGATDIFPNI